MSDHELTIYECVDNANFLCTLDHELIVDKITSTGLGCTLYDRDAAVATCRLVVADLTPTQE